MPDIEKLLKTVVNDIKKDFEVSSYKNEFSYLSTGNPGINYAISGKFDGGFPQGLITEIFGENATGKSLICLHALVETQKQDGVAVLIDSEYAFNPQWYETLGGNLDSLIHYEPAYIEQVYDFIDKVVSSIRKKDKTIPITIVYDSIAASPSKHEYEGGAYDMGKRAQAHGKGIRALMRLCKTQNVTFIGINQLRHTFNLYGLEKDTIGGMAWKYATSVRIRMKKGKKIEQKLDVGKKVVGIHGSLVVEKSRLRAPFSEAEFDIYFDKGIDPLSGLFEVCKNEEVIKPVHKEDGSISRGWYTYKGIKFQKATFVEKVLSKHPELLGGHDIIDVPQNISVVDDEIDEDDAMDADM